MPAMNPVQSKQQSFEHHSTTARKPSFHEMRMKQAPPRLSNLQMHDMDHAHVVHDAQKTPPAAVYAHAHHKQYSGNVQYQVQPQPQQPQRPQSARSNRSHHNPQFAFPQEVQFTFDGAGGVPRRRHQSESRKRNSGSRGRSKTAGNLVPQPFEMPPLLSDEQSMEEPLDEQPFPEPGLRRQQPLAHAHPHQAQPFAIGDMQPVLRQQSQQVMGGAQQKRSSRSQRPRTHSHQYFAAQGQQPPQQHSQQHVQYAHQTQPSGQSRHALPQQQQPMKRGLSTGTPRGHRDAKEVFAMTQQTPIIRGQSVGTPRKDRHRQQSSGYAHVGHQAQGQPYQHAHTAQTAQTQPRVSRGQLGGHAQHTVPPSRVPASHPRLENNNQSLPSYPQRNQPHGAHHMGMRSRDVLPRAQPQMPSSMSERNIHAKARHAHSQQGSGHWQAQPRHSHSKQRSGHSHHEGGGGGGSVFSVNYPVGQPQMARNQDSFYLGKIKPIHVNSMGSSNSNFGAFPHEGQQQFETLPQGHELLEMHTGNTPPTPKSPMSPLGCESPSGTSLNTDSSFNTTTPGVATHTYEQAAAHFKLPPQQASVMSLKQIGAKPSSKRNLNTMPSKPMQHAQYGQHGQHGQHVPPPQHNTHNMMAQRPQQQPHMRRGRDSHRRGIGHSPSKSRKEMAHYRVMSNGTKRNRKKTKDTTKFLAGVIRKEVLFAASEHQSNEAQMTESAVEQMVSKMYCVDIPVGQPVIQAGSSADAYFVIEEGHLKKFKPDAPEGKFEMLARGDSFGQENVLYATRHKHTYVAQALNDLWSNPNATNEKTRDAGRCRCWALERRTFEKIRKRQASRRVDHLTQQIQMLKSTRMFEVVGEIDLQVVSGAMIKIQWDRKHAKVCTKGESATHFFIVNEGECEVVDDAGKVLMTYGPGDCFGELGIIKSQKRARTVRVKSSEGMTAWALPAQDFKRLLDYDEVEKKMRDKISEYKIVPTKAQPNRVECKLEELRKHGVMGKGAFGLVTLVEHPETEQFYALKRISKNAVVEKGQQKHIANEKNIMGQLESKFCIKLFATYQDEKNVYFLLETVMGGELFSLLKQRVRISESAASFYTACAVLALDYLHSELNVIYRDLKPENLLIAPNGYCKLVDYGFAKVRDNNCTLCGTPQYMAPEVIQNLPQGFAVDWWSVGVLVYEMVYGFVPFENDEHMKMYEKILRAPLAFEQVKGVKVREETKDLARQLLQKSPHKRLGAGTKGAASIRKHKFFKKINWALMKEQKFNPPGMPSLQSPKDLAYFERMPDVEDTEELIDDPDGTLFKWCENF